MLNKYRRAKVWIGETFEPLRPVYDAWMKVIAGFSWVMARILLTVTFVTAFLLYGVILRIVRKDPMNRSLDPDTSSYWSSNVLNNDQLEDFRKQY